MTGKIYILIDPETYKIRYVGMTKLSLEERLYLHLKEKYKITYKHNWIKSLKEKGLKPIIQQIDKADTVEQTAIKEMYWINYYLEKGEKLTNHITSFSSRPYKQFLNKDVKKVVQYDMSGNYINTYASATAAACALNSCDSNGIIYQICNGKKKKYTWKGFVFRFEGEAFNKYKIIGTGEHKTSESHKKYLSEEAKKRNSKFTAEHYKIMNSKIKNRRGTPRKKVLQIETNIVFDSIVIASNSTGIPKTTISRHCNNKVQKPLFKFQDIVHS